MPGFPTANPFISSHHDVSLPEGDGRWEGSTSAILLTPGKALLAISAVNETGLYSFLLFSKMSYFFLGSRTFCIVKILGSVHIGEKVERGNQSVKSLSAGTFR